MATLNLDKHTREQASEFANTEAEIHGFPIGSERWKKAYKQYLSFAVGTMSVGRNPRTHRYKVYTSLYPEVFGAQGFAGTVSKKYKRQDGGVEVPLMDVQGRILSSVMNLMKLFENGIMEVKNSTTGSKQGQIPNSDMSELQFPNKKEYATEEEYNAAVKDVFYNWFVRDVISNCILESLSMFFRMTKDDVDTIMAAINIENATIKEVMGKGREEVIKRLRGQVQPVVEKMIYRKIIFKET